MSFPFYSPVTERKVRVLLVTDVSAILLRQSGTISGEKKYVIFFLSPSSMAVNF